MSDNTMRDLPTEGQSFDVLAQMALSQYDLEKPKAAFLRHNENLTFRVAGRNDEQVYLLRLHSPAMSNFPIEFRYRTAIESELCWLEALSIGSDINVQHPVRNVHGELVTMITDEFSGQIIPCTLLQWIEGDPFTQEEPNAAQVAEQMGIMMARMHDHVRIWAVPDGFERPSLDEEYLMRSMRQIEPGIGLGLLSAEDYGLFGEAAAYIANVMSSLGKSSDHWGLIHSDIQGGNILVCHDDISPIDFSLCGFGHFMFDVGCSLLCLRSELRPQFLEGYERLRPLTEDMKQVIEAFAMFSIINCFSYHVPNPDRHEWLSRRMPEVARSYCCMLPKGEPFVMV